MKLATKIAHEVSIVVRVLTAAVACCILALVVVDRSNVPAWCPDNVNPVNCVTGN